MRPHAERRANCTSNGGRDHPHPVAGEAFGSREGPAVDSPITRTIALHVTLEAAQDLDGGAVNPPKCFRDEQLNAVAFRARVAQSPFFLNERNLVSANSGIARCIK